MNQTLRQQVRERAGNRCEYCRLRQEHEPDRPLHIEHIIATKHGGRDDLDKIAHEAKWKSRFPPLDIHCRTMHCVAMINKELVAASTEPLILSLLASGESYGYALTQEVKRLSGDKLQWTDGMLYPVLHRMEQRGLIKSRWDKKESGRKRKYYALKKDGKTAMAKHHEQWSLVHSVLTGLRKEQYV